MQVELNRVPQALKPFFTKAQDGDLDGQVMMTMSYMVYAYGRAFEEFAIAALNDWPKKDHIAQPMCYLARHSIELWLKYAIKKSTRNFSAIIRPALTTMRDEVVERANNVTQRSRRRRRGLR
jgi:hypothetical protein